MENKKDYTEQVAARLKELEREIHELEELADKAVAEMKARYHRQITELFLKKEELQLTHSKIKEASGNAWEDMKSGAELSWEVFNDAVKKSFKKIK